jgi:putative DNA-invertase from lambdoid prophage Rac
VIKIVPITRDAASALRVALYHRVSTLDQNPALARDELHAAALQRGGVVALDVEETGSGAKNNRPGLAQIMEAARAGKLDAVLVWKLDRFGRSTLDLLANVQALETYGCRFIATTQGLDVGGRGGSGAMGKMILTVMAAMAEFERELIRERTVLGMANARAKGTRSGRPIGRAPAALSRAAIDRAAELRAAPAFPKHSWAFVRWRLQQEGVQGLPDRATIARYVQKAHPGIDRGKVGRPRS